MIDHQSVTEHRDCYETYLVFVAVVQQGGLAITAGRSLQSATAFVMEILHKSQTQKYKMISKTKLKKGCCKTVNWLYSFGTVVMVSESAETDTDEDNDIKSIRDRRHTEEQTMKRQKGISKR